MTAGRLGRLVIAAALIAACGDDVAEPLTTIDVDDLSAEQARERPPRAVLEPLLVSAQPSRTIYDPAPNLAKQPPDSVPAAAPGSSATDTAARRTRTDTAAPRATRDTGGATRPSASPVRDSAARSPSS